MSVIPMFRARELVKEIVDNLNEQDIYLIEDEDSEKQFEVVALSDRYIDIRIKYDFDGDRYTIIQD